MIEKSLDKSDQTVGKLYCRKLYGWSPEKGVTIWFNYKLWFDLDFLQVSIESDKTPKFGEQFCLFHYLQMHLLYNLAKLEFSSPNNYVC